MAENDKGTGGESGMTSSTVTSETVKPAPAKKAASSRSRSGGSAPAKKAAKKIAKSGDLEVGAEATADVHLKMQGGYGDDYLVPGEPDAGQPGVLLVQKGDVITAGAVRHFERAESNAKRIAKG